MSWVWYVTKLHHFVPLCAWCLSLCLCREQCVSGRLSLCQCVTEISAAPEPPQMWQETDGTGADVAFWGSGGSMLDLVHVVFYVHLRSSTPLFSTVSPAPRGDRPIGNCPPQSHKLPLRPWCPGCFFFTLNLDFRMRVKEKYHYCVFKK